MEKKKDFADNSSGRVTSILFVLFMLIGVLARVWRFGDIPGGINQDEAFSAYEAYSMLRFGKDSAGYSFPVYLTAWGSGMNVLNSYLMMPFIALFGMNVWVIRLPQVLAACLTLWGSYLLIREIVDEKAALCALFFTAIAPWHIMLSRWGLESNLAPAFLLFGVYFFVRGLHNAKYFMLSAVMYGLSLYCYATIWPFVPLMLLLQLGYCLLYKKIRLQREIVFATGILAVLALPLLLFLLVNKGYISEIRLPFLSIPKLVYMRDSEISLQNISENLSNLWSIIGSQTDGLLWNATEQFGLFYKITLPFFGVGIFYLVKQIVTGAVKKEFRLECFLLIQLLAGVLLGMLIYVNINRVNSLWLPMILVSAMGIWYLCTSINPKILLIPLIVYSVLFVQFERYYFTVYREEIADCFCSDVSDALDEAMSQEGTVYVSNTVNYARVLFYSRQDVNEYIDTVEYTNYPSPFLDVYRFGRFCFYFDLEELDPDGIYLLDGLENAGYLEQAGYVTKEFGRYVVAYRESI